jgi:hypothetical protein
VSEKVGLIRAWVTLGDNLGISCEGTMAHGAAAKQFSFRLPGGLVDRVERCTEDMQRTGLEVTRADVVRLLLKHALDTTHCKLELLLGGKSSKRRSRRRQG